MHDRAPDNVAASTGDTVDFALLEQAPSGAFALAGVAVGLLVVAWLLMYVLVFIPRGPVG